MAKLKAEFLYQWQKIHGVLLRSWMIANITRINRIGSLFPWLTNFFLSNRIIKKLVFKPLGFAKDRDLPLLYKTTLRSWYKKKRKSFSNRRRVFLLVDEFTNYNDTAIGIKAVELLEKLGYEVLVPSVRETGRTYISKGLLKSAQRIANANVDKLYATVSQETPLIGIEPSAILSFRDEYPDLVSPSNKEKAQALSSHCLLFEEFFQREVELGYITKEMFKSSKQAIKLHGHCQQKAVASTKPTIAMLSFPDGYTVEEIPSGCCGMAGSFGYEKEHFDLSMKVGELVLFPAIRKTPEKITIVAPGTSCRHQIKDGTTRSALHPIEVMWNALV
jgi:Fe-S oxidoreductase